MKVQNVKKREEKGEEDELNETRDSENNELGIETYPT